jgi:hypothetical protein
MLEIHVCSVKYVGKVRLKERFLNVDDAVNIF